jgi:ketosteroid isomerase-like protein
MQRKSIWELGSGRLRNVLLACGIAMVSPAQALEVGNLRLERETGKPMRAEIPLIDRGPVVATDLRVRIAARETFEVAGLRYHPSLAKVQIQAKQLPNGRVVLLLEGLPADAGKLDLLLTVSDRASLTIAEFRIDTQEVGKEFSPARAGSSLAAQQKRATAQDDKPGEARAAEAKSAAAKTETATAPGTPVAASTSARPAAAAAASTTVLAASDPRPALAAAVEAWADAWSRRDVDAYLAAYAPGFVSADRSLSYEAWAKQRRQRILARVRIEVRIEALELEPKGSDWIASFIQQYRADGRKESTRKQLLLRQIEGRWLIVGERQDR